MCPFVSMLAFAAGYAFAGWDKKHGARVGMILGRATRRLLKR